MRRILALGLAVALIGCTRPRLEIELPAEPDPPPQSMLVSLERDVGGDGCGTLVSLIGRDLPLSPGATLPKLESWDGKAAMRVRVRYYAKDLHALGITNGEVGVLTPGMTPPAGQGCDIPPEPQLVKERSFSGEPRGDWADVASDAPTCFCIPRPDLCATFEPRLINLTMSSSISSAWAVGVGQDGALLGLSSIPRLYLLSKEGELRPVTVQGHLTIDSAVVADDQNLYFGGNAGEIWRGRLSGDRLETTLVTTSTSGQPVYWIIGRFHSDGAIDLLYTLGLHGALDRYEAATGRWTNIDLFTAEGAGIGNELAGALAWVSPADDEVLAMKAVSKTIARVKHGVSTREQVADSPSGLCAAARVPGVGMVVGNGRGGFYADAGHGWTALPESDYRLHLRALAAYGSGFIYGGDTGFFGQYLGASHKFCSAMQVAPDTVNNVVVLGDDLLLGGTKPGSTMNFSMVLAKRR